MNTDELHLYIAFLLVLIMIFLLYREKCKCEKENLSVSNENPMRNLAWSYYGEVQPYNAKLPPYAWK